MKRLVLLLFLWCSLATARADIVVQTTCPGNNQSVGTSVGCTTVLTDNKAQVSYSYDLTPLWHAEGEGDMLYYRNVDGDYYFVNFCGQSSAGCEGTDFSDYTYYSFGKTSSQKFFVSDQAETTIGTGILVTYTGGDECTTGGLRTTKIYVQCDGNYNPGFFSSVDHSDYCNLIMTFKSVSGCGKKVPYTVVSSSSEGGSPHSIRAGGIILILLSVAVVVYLVAGAAFKYKYRDARSVRELIPNFEFWAAIPGLVKDGVLFVFHGFKKGDYTSL